MKATPHLLLAITLTGLTSAAPMKDRVTGEELDARRMASASPISTLSQPEKESRISRPAAQSIISQSVILTDGSNWTLIPNGAVLHLPEKHQSKIGTKPVGKLLSWREFLAANHAWVSAEEITLRQAEGLEEFEERRVAFWPKQAKTIIAVHRGGPISVAASEDNNSETH